jgi:hypothetical protein
MILRKRNRSSNENLSKDKVALKIAKLLLKIQDKFSAFMSTCTKNIPAKNLKALLAVFCLLGAGSSIYFITEAIFKNDKQQPALKIEKVNVPNYFEQDDNLQIEQSDDPGTYEAIQRFERYMDSLQQTMPGRELHDSILITRPGLMDSIKMVKEIFNSQIKL